MIIGIGIDSIEIERFKKWYDYAQTTLERIFSPQEIEYCLEISIKSAERFAARFAIREAFYKSLYSAFPNITIPFLTVCKNIKVKKSDNQQPVLIIDWKKIINNEKDMHLNSFISLTHTKTIATAVVILEKSD